MGTISAKAASRTAADLPRPRGPLSSWVIAALDTGTSGTGAMPCPADADPWGEDAQLALFVCQEMHYRGWAGVDPSLEWAPHMVAARVTLEDRLLAAVERDIPPSTAEASAIVELEELARASTRPGGAVERLRTTLDRTLFEDYFAARSLYHLKEADPHAWAIPRLEARSKAPYVAVVFDEYGAGHGDHVHQRLYADLLAAMGMNADYLAYLDHAPAAAMAPVTLMSAFGLRRAELGAAIGHFAATEVASPPGSARMLTALERLGAPEPVQHFYREHVEADAVHEQVMRHDVVGAMVADSPELERAVVKGIAAWRLVEDRLDAALLGAWDSGTTVMRRP